MRRILQIRVFAHTSNTTVLTPLLTGMLLVATGCGSTQQISPHESDGYARITDAATGETARVYFHDGRTMELENLYVGIHSTTGDLPQGGSKSFSTASVWKVEIVDRGIGFFKGAGLGIAAPLASGAFVSLMEEDEFIPGWFLGAVLSIPGALIGGAIGIIRGERDAYILLERTPKPDSTTVLPKTRVSKKSSRE